MSYATIPLIWIFATRNNGFLWATGWSYRTFNIYHRHVARVGTVLAVIHSIGYAYCYVSYAGGWSELWKELGEKWLLLGLIVSFQSTPQKRNRVSDSLVGNRGHGFTLGLVACLDQSQVLRVVPTHPHRPLGRDTDLPLLPHIHIQRQIRLLPLASGRDMGR